MRSQRGGCGVKHLGSASRRIRIITLHRSILRNIGVPEGCFILTSIPTQRSAASALGFFTSAIVTQPPFSIKLPRFQYDSAFSAFKFSAALIDDTNF